MPFSFLIFFFCIKLVLFSQEPFRVFPVTHALIFLVMRLLWICFHSLCWTQGLSIWKFVFCSWEKFSQILSLIPSHLFPCFLIFLYFLSFLNFLSSPYSDRFLQFIFQYYYCILFLLWILNFLGYLISLSSNFLASSVFSLCVHMYVHLF